MSALELFTPGPYVIEPLQATNGADLAICAPSAGYVIAVIQHDPDKQESEDVDGENVVFSDEELATASLLAASGDLYEALKDVLKFVPGYREGDHHGRPHLTKALAAIEKARTPWRPKA